MGWHEAYLAQARSDHRMFRRLSAPDVEPCHRLHYLQMMTEKPAKAMLTPRGSRKPAPPSHAVFVRALQVLKTRPELREKLGYTDAGAFKRYIDSLLDLAGCIERLSPDRAGFTQPNPEYPWEDALTQVVRSPAEHGFSDFSDRKPRMLKIHGLVEDLLQVVNQGGPGSLATRWLQRLDFFI